jgi:hypothetical protein
VDVDKRETGDEREAIARLEARVATLEAALERRSRELRLIQKHVCKRDLVLISRLLAGLPPLPLGAYEPDFWHETTALTAAEVDETLADLWKSLTPISYESDESTDEPAQR